MFYTFFPWNHYFSRKMKFSTNKKKKKLPKPIKGAVPNRWTFRFPYLRAMIENIIVIVCLSVWFHLIGDDLNWEELPIACLSVWFHLISFLSKNNGFLAKMCGTLKIDLSIHYNFCVEYFFPRSIFIDIKYKKWLWTLFFVSPLKIIFAGICIIIFVIIPCEKTFLWEKKCIYYMKSYLTLTFMGICTNGLVDPWTWLKNNN